MAGYSVITDIGNGLVKLLRSQMVPEVILNPDGIGLCSPSEKGDFSLGIYLYDVAESGELAGSGPRMRSSGGSAQRYPSKFLTLYYMITAYSSSDIKFRAAEEQRILGKTIQTLNDYSILGSEWVGESGISSDFPMRIEMQRLENEEKMKLWNIPNVPYKLSLFYKVYPVEIESQKVKEVKRVVDLDITIEEQKQMR